MPKKPSAQAKSEGRRRAQKMYDKQKKQNDADNLQRRARGLKQIDWPYEDLADFVGQLGSLLLNLGTLGTFALIDLIKDECNQEENEHLMTYPSWHENAGEEVCVKCPGNTVPFGWNKKTGKPICQNPGVSSQSGGGSGVQGNKRKKSKQDCLKTGGLAWTNSKGKKICARCEDGSAPLGLDDNDNVICAKPKAPTTSGSKASCKGGKVMFSPLSGKRICFKCKDGQIPLGVAPNGRLICPKPKASTTSGSGSPC